MPDSPAKKWSQPEAVPDPEKNLAPWDRKNPSYGVGAGKDEKATHVITARVTTREHRDIQKIIQHRRYPVIENTSDAIRVGLVMLRYWYAINHNEPAMQEELDIEMWESERLARQRYRDRVLKVLDGMAAEMGEAKRLGYENRLKTLRAELARYKSKLTDEELLGKANRLYVDYASTTSKS